MRILFVHGINHQNSSADLVVESWLAALAQVISPNDLKLIKQQEIVAPFYGKELHTLTEGLTKAGDQLQPQAVGAVVGDEARFYRDVLVQLEREKYLPMDMVDAEELMIPQGPFYHNRRVIAMARLVERLSPLRGTALLRLLPQAFTYLRRAQAAAAVDAIVEPEISKGPCIVVAHSLGTIVTFKLLRKLRHSVPYLITIGSPLAIQAVQNPLGTPFGRQPAVAKWLNALDPSDFVTIGKPLTSTNFGSGIDNIVDVNNGTDDPHDVCMYLRDKHVASTLVAAVKSFSQS
jgi:hypothetical protein